LKGAVVEGRSLNALSPKLFEPRRRQLSVAHRVLDVAVPKVSLQGARIVPLVGQRVAAGVPEHVGMSLEAQLSFGTRPLDHAPPHCPLSLSVNTE